jgi:hypothetical protein
VRSDSYRGAVELASWTGFNNRMARDLLNYPGLGGSCMSLILIILVLVLLLGGGGGYYYGGPAIGSGVGGVLLLIIVLWLLFGHRV